MATIIDGVKIVNCTPHEIRFINNAGEVVTVEKSGYTLPAKAIEVDAGVVNGVQLVKTRFEGSDKGDQELTEVEAGNPGAIIVGSIISAQAFPGRVMALVPVPGTERAAPQDKRFLPNKFTTF